jgi:MscS family membrane protein
MWMSFWQETFYSNTVQQWAWALGLALGVWLASRLIYWLSANVLRRFTERTATRVDDILLDTLQQPLILLFTLMGFLVAYHQLDFPEAFDAWMERAYHAAITLSVTWLIARVVDAGVREVLVPYAERSDTRIDDHLVPLARKGLRTVIWVLGVIVALNNAGYNVGALLAGLGIGGLALAMAAKDTVANIFGGITVLTDKPFMVGDRIRIDKYDGTVLEVGVRSTRIRTLEGPVVVVPNFRFTDTMLENVTAEPWRRIRHDIGLVYGTPPERMEVAVRLLNEIVDGMQDVLEQDRLVTFNSYGSFSLNIMFICYIRKGADIFGTQTQVSLEILRRFNANGLSFAFPTQTLHVVQEGQ